MYNIFGYIKLINDDNTNIMYLLNKIYNTSSCKNLIEYNDFLNLLTYLIKELDKFKIIDYIELFHNNKVINIINNIIFSIEIDNFINLYLICDYLLLDIKYFNKMSCILISYFNINTDEYIKYNLQISYKLNQFYENEILPNLFFYINYKTDLQIKYDYYDKIYNNKKKINKEYNDKILDYNDKILYYKKEIKKNNYKFNENHNVYIFTILFNKFSSNNIKYNKLIKYNNSIIKLSISQIEYNLDAYNNSKIIEYVELAAVCNNLDLIKKLVNNYNLENLKINSIYINDKYFSSEIKSYLKSIKFYKYYYINLLSYCSMKYI